MRSIILILGFAALLAVFVLSVAMAPPKVAEEKPATTGPEQVWLEAGRQKSVLVPHRLHQEALEDCNLCHNLFPQIAGSIKKLKAEGKLETQQVMNQCRGCHRDRAIHGKMTGPTHCSGCHKARSKR